MLFNHVYLVFCSYFSIFELNTPYFFPMIEKEEEYQNLLFLASSVHVGLFMETRDESGKAKE